MYIDIISIFHKHILFSLYNVIDILCLQCWHWYWTNGWMFFLEEYYFSYSEHSGITCSSMSSVAASWAPTPSSKLQLQNNYINTSCFLASYSVAFNCIHGLRPCCLCFVPVSSTTFQALDLLISWSGSVSIPLSWGHHTRVCSPLDLGLWSFTCLIVFRITCM